MYLLSFPLTCFVLTSLRTTPPVVAPDRIKDRLRLGPAHTYEYAFKGRCTEVNTIDDASDFDEVCVGFVLSDVVFVRLPFLGVD